MTYAKRISVQWGLIKNRRAYFFSGALAPIQAYDQFLKINPNLEKHDEQSCIVVGKFDKNSKFGIVLTANLGAGRKNFFVSGNNLSEAKSKIYKKYKVQCRTSRIAKNTDLLVNQIEEVE